MQILEDDEMGEQLAAALLENISKSFQREKQIEWLCQRWKHRQKEEMYFGDFILMSTINIQCFI